MASSPVDEAALPPNEDWAVFGDELAFALKQAYVLKLINDDSLKTISGNLVAGRFTKEHYIDLYGESLVRALTRCGCISSDCRVCTTCM
jgi:hypothetical protein